MSVTVIRIPWKACPPIGSKILAGALILLVLLTAAPAAAQKAGSPDRFVTIDFNNVDINVFIKFISELTGKNFIVDQRVRGNVTIVSPTKISVDEAYKVFESVLDVYGFSTVPSGKVIKILPAPEARATDIETRFDTRPVRAGDRLITQLVPLTYADANEVRQLITPLVSRNSVVAAYPATNMLIIIDAHSNIQRLLKIIAEIDIEGIGRQVAVLPLVHADSKKLVSTLTTVFQAAPGAKDPRQRVTFVADERTNSLVVLANEIDTARVKELVSLLDQETPRGQERIQVYYLAYADAEELSKVLQQLPSQKGEQGQPPAAAPMVSQNVKVTADKATNSLVIVADSEDYMVLEEIIRQLDIPRPMVYIESLIMEVDVRKDFEIGTEWATAGETHIQGKQTVGGAGFIRPPEATALPGFTDGTFPSGLSLGVFTEKITVGGLEFNNLSALIRAAQEDSYLNIISTPQILTTENEEAEINVGKNVPYQTRTSTSDNETFNTFEYRDVGTILKITPHITQERLVRLTIGLEVQVLESTVDFRPTTLKRTIDTTVIVQDGNTIVIGGLIDDTNAENVFKVPLLGDIPVLGYLFKYRSDSRRKTNLFIFLTPHVINRPEEAETLYGGKKKHIEELGEGRVKLFGDSPANTGVEPISPEPAD